MNAPPIPVLDVQALFYAYKNHRAVNGVTFTVAAKSIHGFVGPNGAGKTTTLKILATLLRPQSGSVRLFGNDIVADAKAVRRKIGFMPDHFSMYRQMTVFEYLDFFAAAYGMDLSTRDRIIKDVLTLTDMEGRKEDFIKGLSRGMQQRVSLARVLVHDPDLLLLDEPASGLDPRARIELMQILEELRRMGKTIFISSHILSELATLCDSVTILDRGTVRYSGLMKGLLAHSGEVAPYLLALADFHEPSETALRQLKGVADVVKLEGDPKYRIVFDETLTNPNAILRVVLDRGGQVVAFQEDLKHLNQAFMDLTEPGVTK